MSDGQLETHYATEASATRPQHHFYIAIRGRELGRGERGGAYNTPAMNTADAPIFFLVGICSCQIAWSGRITVTTLETTLKMAAARMTRAGGAQYPGIFGCQYLLIGEQVKMHANVMAI